MVKTRRLDRQQSARPELSFLSLRARASVREEQPPDIAAAPAFRPSAHSDSSVKEIYEGTSIALMDSIGRRHGRLPKRNRHPRRLPHFNRERQPIDPRAQAAEILTQRDEELRTLKDLVIKTYLELESVREEWQSIRKQLDN